MGSSQIRQRIEDILRFMQPHWEFVNCHMVNYLTEQHWDRFIPAVLREEVPNTASVHSCIETVFWQEAGGGAAGREKFPEFEKFMALCAQYRLDMFTDVLTTRGDLNNILQRPEINQKVSIREFMSEKKRHEVEITAALVDTLVGRYRELNGGWEIFIVDAGDGKGYLSSRLALQYGHRVLGIDCNALNTQNALERNRKLQRAWNGLIVRAEMKSKDLTTSSGKTQMRKFSPNRGTTAGKLGNYKTISRFIFPELNIVELLQNNFTSPKEESKESALPAICLTGLHTCGNLAPTCIEMFHAQPQCKILCNIGCCYHLLKELFSEKEFFEQKAASDIPLQAGFPMSTFLKEKGVKLGRNARMLAAQSVERTRNAKTTTNLSLFYRALLEVLVSEKAADRVPKVQVGKIRKFESFEEYVELCCRKEHFNTSFFQPDRVAAIQRDFADHRHFMELFYLLRMQFAPILESLILLDRLLYLKELGYEHSFLVPIFDAIISPRHFSVIAFKDGIK